MALYVGRVAPEKNVELAITAFRAMQRRNGAAKLVIVGDGLRTPYADADAFVDAAVRLTEDSTLRNRIRRQARAHAAALDWQAVVDRFAALLTDAPTRARASTRR